MSVSMSVSVFVSERLRAVQRCTERRSCGTGAEISASMLREIVHKTMRHIYRGNDCSESFIFIGSLAGLRQGTDGPSLSITP